MARIGENKYIILGILGALIVLFGTTRNSPQLYYIAGAVALLTTAIHYKLFYFIALELILMAGHGAILFGSGPYTQLALPILLCLQLLIFYFIIDEEYNLFLILGIFGIALFSLGFSDENQWVFFLGNTLIATYAYYSGYCKRLYPAYIWALLNTIFACLSLYKIFF